MSTSSNSSFLPIDISKLVKKRNFGFDATDITEIRIIRLDKSFFETQSLEKAEMAFPVVLHLSLLDQTSQSIFTWLREDVQSGKLVPFLERDVDFFSKNIMVHSKLYDIYRTWEVEYEQPQAITRLEVDSTNLHYLVEFSGEKKAHVKEYTRLGQEQGQREEKTARILSSKGRYPSIWGTGRVKVGDLDENVWIITEHLEGINTDDLSFELLKKYSETQNIMYLDRLEKLLSLVIGALGDLHSIPIENREKEVQQTKVLWRKHLMFLKGELNGISLMNLHNSIISATDIDILVDTLIEMIDTVFDDYDFTLIHNDAWWRQFFWIGDQNLSDPGQIVILDLEDVLIGPWAYDIGSLQNSILQQAFYYSENFPDNLKTAKKTGNMLKAKCEELVSTGYPWVVDEDLKKKLNWARSVRSLHEIIYLSRFQPEEDRLRAFIISSLPKL